VAQNYEHLFKANAPAEVPPTNAPGGRGAAIPRHSHYLQSKVVRARERIEAELEIAREEPPAEPPASTA
jgi:mitochondrial import inner membrane translocase subunit TIM16